MCCGQLNYAVMRGIYVLKLNRMFDQINSRYSVYRFLLWFVCVCDSNSFVFGSSQHFTFFFCFRGIQQSTHTEDSCVVSRGSIFVFISLIVFFFFTCTNFASLLLELDSQYNKENANLRFLLRSGTKTNLFLFLRKMHFSLILGQRALAKQNAQFRTVNMLQLINLGNLYSYPILKIHNSLFTY